MITGMEYYRREHRLNKCDLAKRTGLEVSRLEGLLDIRKIQNIQIAAVMKASSALGVTADELIMSRDESELEDFKRYRVTQNKNPGNCISNYRLEKRYTLEHLGKLMGGMTREGARRVCDLPIPPQKYLQRLAEYEGMTASDFEERYGKGGGQNGMD